MEVNTSTDNDLICIQKRTWAGASQLTQPERSRLSARGISAEPIVRFIPSFENSFARQKYHGSAPGRSAIANAFGGGTGND